MNLFFSYYQTHFLCLNWFMAIWSDWIAGWKTHPMNQGGFLAENFPQHRRNQSKKYRYIFLSLLYDINGLNFSMKYVMLNNFLRLCCELAEMKTLNPSLPNNTILYPLKKKSLRFCDVFRGFRNITPRRNGSKLTRRMLSCVFRALSNTYGGVFCENS